MQSVALTGASFHGPTLCGMSVCSEVQCPGACEEPDDLLAVEHHRAMETSGSVMGEAGFRNLASDLGRGGTSTTISGTRIRLFGKKLISILPN